jgi:hypothetical protein
LCNIKPKVIKKTINILASVIAVIVLISAALPLLLNSSKIQNLIARSVVQQLSATLHTKVSVGEVTYRIFDQIHIKDIYVEDLHKDTLLFVKDADAAFRFWQFFKGKVIFKGIKMDHFYGNLKIDSTGATNMDFVIKAFSKKEKKDSSNIEYRIKYLKIANSSFRIRNVDKNQKNIANRLNPNNLYFTDINTDIQLDVLKGDSLNFELKKFSLKERSGLIIDNITTSLIGSKKGVKIPEFQIELPQSLIKLQDVELKYDSISDIKQFAKKVKWNAPFKNAYITPSDLACLAPELKGLKGRANVNGLISGRLSALRFEKMKLQYGNSLFLSADLDISGLPNLNEAFFYGQINNLKVERADLQDIISSLTHKPFVLSKELAQLGQLSYKGNITGFLSNLVVYGNLQTNLGNLTTDILLKLENNLQDLSYNGSIKTSGFDLGKMLKSDQVGKLSVNFNTKGTKLYKKPLRGEINATVGQVDFNQYLYKDIKFDGKYDGTGFDGKIDVNDENIDADFRGIVDLTKKIPVFDFEMNLAHADLNALHLVKKLKNSDLSLKMKTNMTGNSPDNMNGFIKLDSLRFTNNNKTLNAGQITFVSRTEENSTNFSVKSDYLNGSFNGNFKYSTIGYTLRNILKYYLPSVTEFIGGDIKNQSNQVDIDFTLDNTKEVADVFGVPYYFDGKATLKGSINENLNKIDIRGNVPSFKASTLKVENISLQIDNSKQVLQLTTRAQLPDKGGLISMYAISKIANDSVETNIGWQNANTITNAGDIHTTAKFFDNNGKTEARLKVFPTQVIIADSIWNIKNSTIDLKSDSTVHINNLSFGHNDQYFYINGIASSNNKDSLMIKTNQIDLDFITRILKLKGVSIGGELSGQIKIFRTLDKPYYFANLTAKDFSLNKKRIGDGSIVSTWDATNKLVLLDGHFVDGNDIVALAKGYYVPKDDSINLNIDARKFSIEFLSRYFDGVADNVKGYGSGNMRMFGPMKHIGFEGNVLVQNASATLSMLKTTYYFNDSVFLKRKSIEFRNLKLYDEGRNKGILNGYINHDGSFSNMKYDVNIVGTNILVMNTQAEDNEYFFGKAYVTGNVRITGNDNEANIVAKGVTRPKTKCYIQMGGASTATESDFVVFVSPTSRVLKQPTKVKVPGEDFNTKIDLQIDVTPDAEMEMIVDPKGGDVITGQGSGNLRVQFDTFSDIFLYGNYTLSTGHYLFTLQTLIRKEFTIQNGSTLSWTGDPFGAKVNINAIYSLTASLKDLMDQAELQNTTTRTSVPVNCVLKLTDDLMKPKISFDIDLPSSDESTKQKVKSIINTEEMMNRQIAYLLVLNKFFTPSYLQSTQTTPLGVNEAISFGMSTLSSHLTNWIKQAFNTNSLSLGFDWQKSEAQQDEYKAQVLYQPNSRLIVNGNFGYTTERINTTTNSSPFSADIDLEYLLTESGKYRFKAYNHTVDRAQLREARNSQGLGFVYKEDFASVSDMINYYFGWLKKKKTE